MQSNRPDISVIVLNWNNGPDTIECLDSIYTSKGVHFDVYVVDNGSSDGSLEKIRNKFPSAHYIQNQQNLGFAEGNNRGLKKALEGGASYFFLLNNDAVIQENTLALLKLTAEEHADFAIFGPTIYYYDDPTTIWYAGGDWNPLRASFYHRYWNDLENSSRDLSPQATGYVCGCAFFIRAAAVKKAGMMDPRFFLNWEEIDWCWRLKKQGFYCLYVPEAKCWHKMSRSFIGGKRGPMWLYFYWRNRLLWMERHLKGSEFFHLAKKVLLPEIQQIVKELFIKDKREEAKACLTGIFHYFFRSFGGYAKYTAKKKASSQP